MKREGLFLEPLVSAIIINYNTKDFLRDCLKSIYENVDMEKVPMEVLVADNASTDGSVDMIKKEFPQVILIENEKNLGTSIPRNQLLERARGKYALILDSDTVVTPGAVEKMLEYAESRDDLGILCPRLSFPDGSYQNSVRRFPGVIELIFRRLEPLFDNTERMKLYYLKDKDMTKIQEVDYGISACFFAPMSVLNKSGFFDPFLFRGGDIELCARVKKIGYKIIYYPHAEIIHHQQRITKKDVLRNFHNFKALLHVIKGAIYVFWKHKFFRDIPKIPKK